MLPNGDHKSCEGWVYPIWLRFNPVSIVNRSLAAIHTRSFPTYTNALGRQFNYADLGSWTKNAGNDLGLWL